MFKNKNPYANRAREIQKLVKRGYSFQIAKALVALAYQEMEYQKEKDPLDRKKGFYASLGKNAKIFWRPPMPRFGFRLFCSTNY